jgi:hypothetical protein
MIDFLNFAMVAGGVAAGVPILVHLLNKRRFKRVPWGAMMFLRASLSRVSRRIRMENFLLLLLRILIIAAIVAAFMRPYVKTKFTLFGGQSKTAMVILIDGSLSMQYERDGKMNLEHAKQAAKDLVNSLKKGDSVSIFVITDRTEPVAENPIWDFKRAEDGIDSIKPSFKRADFVHAVDTAVRHLPKLKNPAKEIFVITDLQQSGWSPDKLDYWREVVKPLSVTKDYPQPPPIKIVDISEGKTENTAITSVSYEPRTVGVNRDVSIIYQAWNYGKSARAVRVTPTVGAFERPLLAKSPMVEAERSVTDSIPLKFDTPGKHAVVLRAEDDEMKADNVRYLVVNVLKDVPVLVADGAPSLQPFKGETDFLGAALSPRLSTQIGGETLALAKPRIVRVPEFQNTNLSEYPVVILANVSNLDAAKTTELERYVEEGGGLLIFPGDLTDMQYFNTLLYRDGKGILPGAIVETEGDDKDREKYVNIGGPPYSHPALKQFNDPSKGDLTIGRIRKWFKLDVPPGDDKVTVMAAFTNGRPWLVEKKVGRGRVILCSTPCDADWTDLPVRKFYVPLVHELVYYLATGEQTTSNLLVGKTIDYLIQSETLDQESGELIHPAEDTGIPSAESRRTKVQFVQERGGWIARSEPLNHPGIYRLVYKTAEGEQSVDFAVNLDTEEFNLTQLSDKEAASLKDAMGGEVIKVAEISNLEKQRFGVEIWRHIAYILLVLLFVELWMTSRRTKRQDVDAVEVPDAVLNK